MADKNVREHRHCPFCDQEIAEAAFPYCQACGLAVLTCPRCGISVARDSETCPGCGASLREKNARED